MMGSILSLGNILKYTSTTCHTFIGRQNQVSLGLFISIAIRVCNSRVLQSHSGSNDKYIFCTYLYESWEPCQSLHVTPSPSKTEGIVGPLRCSLLPIYKGLLFIWKQVCSFKYSESCTVD